MNPTCSGPVEAAPEGGVVSEVGRTGEGREPNNDTAPTHQGVWREPDEESTDLYPGLVVHDGRVSGSITVGPSRLPLWAFAGWDWDEVVDAWDYIESDYGWTERRHRGFLYDLLEMRGEFGRLLLMLANAERLGQERRDEWNAAHDDGSGLVVVPLDEDSDYPAAWWGHADIREPIITHLVPIPRLYRKAVPFGACTCRGGGARSRECSP